MKIETAIGEMQLPCTKHQGNSATPEARGETWNKCFLIRVSRRNHNFPSGSVLKNLPANTGDPGSFPGSERSPRRANDHPLQYSCLENPMDREAWWAIVHGVVFVGYDWAQMQKETTLLTLWFQISGLLNCQRIDFCGFKAPYLLYLLHEP